MAGTRVLEVFPAVPNANQHGRVMATNVLAAEDSTVPSDGSQVPSAIRRHAEWINIGGGRVVRWQ
ncbi:MAG: hypothetical protein Q9168_004148 [Polycauliona sp. 1 TL-2023]